MAGGFGTDTSALLLREVADDSARVVDRHLASADDWMPYFDAEQSPDELALDEHTRAALLVNLLTEDNLPYYARESALFLAPLGGNIEPYEVWARRWVAEEARHSIAIRGSVVATRCIDLEVLERLRLASMCQGWVAPFRDHIEGMIYTALQELATRIAHRNTFTRLPKVATEFLTPVVTDENRHHLFYRDLASSVRDLDPDTFVTALERQVRDFDVPGTGVAGFRDLARSIARVGIYNASIFVHHVVTPLVKRHWRIEEAQLHTDAGERARERLLSRIERLGRLASRMDERLAAAAPGPSLAGKG